MPKRVETLDEFQVKSEPVKSKYAVPVNCQQVEIVRKPLL